MFILKQLRRKKNLSRTDLANAIGVSLRTIQLYEKKDANIPIKNLTKIAQYFDLSIAELYMHEVNETAENYIDQKMLSKKGNTIKPLGSGKYLITVPLVSGEMVEDYFHNLEDTTFVDKLSRIGFVLEHIEDTYHVAFEITNNSMDNGSIEGIPNKAIVLGKSVSKKELSEALDNQRYHFWVMVYKGGIMCKEIVAYDKTNKSITCHSLNSSPEYSDFQINLEDIKELFAVIKKQLS